MRILIDNAHGQSTPGKRSPDGRFLEFKFNREIAQLIVADLGDRGYDAELLVEEDDDDPDSGLVEILDRYGVPHSLLEGTKDIWM